MANLKDIVYCTEEQLKTMSSGTPVSGHEYDENDLYITPLDDDIIVGADGSGTKINENNELVVDPTYIHDTVDTDIAEAKTIAERAEVIARGRATAYIYDTVEDLETALADEEFVASLVVGDNFYIRALDVPDYWWDGTTKQQLESEKPDLSGLVKDVQINGTTIVTSGVANIPPASETEFGVIKMADGNGIKKKSDNTIVIDDYIADEIVRTRSTSWKKYVVTNSNIDRWVRECMCDTLGKAWNDVEKANSRARMGAVSADDVTAMITEALNAIGVAEEGAY